MPHCPVEGCKVKYAEWGIRGVIGERRCARHRTDEMICLAPRDHSCREEGCSTKASFSLTGSYPLTHCKSHASSGMTSKKDSCRTEGCPISASYGFEKRTHCKKHAEEGMRSLFRKLCPCGKRAVGGSLCTLCGRK